MDFISRACYTISNVYLLVTVCIFLSRNLRTPSSKNLRQPIGYNKSHDDNHHFTLQFVVLPTSGPLHA